MALIFNEEKAPMRIKANNERSKYLSAKSRRKIRKRTRKKRSRVARNLKNKKGAVLKILKRILKEKRILKNSNASVSG
uniref:BZIP domain-containing protein n=1 Tax=Syphacia muris TaxID=451379 RepID=A0A0N5AHF9_9BILA